MYTPLQHQKLANLTKHTEGNVREQYALLEMTCFAGSEKLNPDHNQFRRNRSSQREISKRAQTDRETERERKTD